MAQPDLIPMPFAENATPGTIEPIEATTPTVPQDATWSTGFPQVTMQPLASGGIPPRGQNFNGVLNALSQHIFHTQGGGQYKWDAAHGPYSIGDVLQSDDGLRSYVSVVDNNTDNFNTNPSAIGDTWLPWSGGSASELVSGLVKIATTAEAKALTNDTKALTPKKLGDAIGTAATRDVGTGNGNVMQVGAGGWLGSAPSSSYSSGYPQTVSQSVSQVYRRETADNGVNEYSSSIHFAAGDTWGRLRVSHNLHQAWVQGGSSSEGTGWTAELYHTGNIPATATRWPAWGEVTGKPGLLGIGQAWHNVTGSRGSGTFYTNNTGRPIYIAVSGYNAAASLYINGAHVLPGGNGSNYVSAIVPSGSTYRVDCNNIHSWAELR